MARTLLLTAALLALAVLGSACSTTARYITHTVNGDDHVYIAYGEVEATNYLVIAQYKTTSRILRCDIQPDNRVVCAEQENATSVLNPHLR